MIYCATKPIEEYGDYFPEMGLTVGLHYTYGNNPALLNLILLTTIVPYGYEEGTEKKFGENVATIKYEDKFKNTLTCEVKGMTVEVVVTTMNPVEVYRFIEHEDIEDWPICDIYPHRSKAIKNLIGGRAAAWATNYRGVVEKRSNLITASFGGSLPFMNDLSEGMIKNNNDLKEAINGRAKFLTDYEKEKFFFDASRMNREDYPAATTMKIYENMEFYIYNYTDQLNIVGMYKVLSIGMSGQGLFVSLMDKRTYRSWNVGCKPIRLLGFNVVCHIPVRVEIERTIKKMDHGGYIYGVSCGLVVRYHSEPTERISGDDYTVPFYLAGRVLGREELEEALERLEL